MATLAGDPGEEMILAATVVTVLGTFVPRLELTGVKAFFRLRPLPVPAVAVVEAAAVAVVVSDLFVASSFCFLLEATVGAAVGAVTSVVLLVSLGTFSFCVFF